MQSIKRRAERESARKPDRSELPEGERGEIEQTASAMRPEGPNAGIEHGRRGAQQAGEDSAPRERGGTEQGAAAESLERRQQLRRNFIPARDGTVERDEGRDVREALRQSQSVATGAIEPTALLQQETVRVRHGQAHVELVEAPSLIPRDSSDRPGIDEQQRGAGPERHVDRLSQARARGRDEMVRVPLERRPAADLDGDALHRRRATLMLARIGPATFIDANGVPHQTAVPVGSDPDYDLIYQRLASPPSRVLVIGAGNGTDVATALAHGAQSVDAVEIDPKLMGIGVAFFTEIVKLSPALTLPSAFRSW